MSTDPIGSLFGHDLTVDSLIKLSIVCTLLVLPFTVEPFYRNLIIRAYILGIFALSVDILWGYNGILTFGHAAFFGFGAYIMAKVLKASPFAGADFLGLILAVIAPAVVGLVIAAVLFYRGVVGDIFTIITLAIAVIAERVVISWGSVTGGYNGITAIPPIEFGIPGVYTAPLEGLLGYYVILGFLAGAFLFSRRVVTSPFGTTLVAIRENEAKARALGYDLPLYKTLAFAVTCGLAGFAGGLYSSHTGVASPTIVGFALSTQVILFVLIGGRGTLIGPIVGAFVLTLFEDFISATFQFGWILLLGVVLIVVVITLPGGIMQLLSVGRNRLSNRG